MVANGLRLRRTWAALGIIAILVAAPILASAGEVSVRIRAGKYICRAAPTVDGWYSAGHCAQYPGGITSVAGLASVPPYSVDAGGRDLAHITGPAHDVTLRAPVAGEGATIRMSTTASSFYTVVGTVDGRVYTRERTPGDYLLLCWREGHLPRAGMSGSGFYADSDAALLAVMSNGGPVPWSICASGEAALGVAVP